MFDAVYRLASDFVALCNAGNSRYLEWRKEIKCCLDEGKYKFDQTIQEIESACLSMENHLHEWEKTLHLKRSTYPNLNFFTVQQIVFLQKKLCGLSSSPATFVENLPTQVFTLLENVYPDVSKEVLRNAILSASYELKYGWTSEQQENWEKVEMPEDRFQQANVNDIERFLLELENEGLSDDVALAATNACGLENMDEALVWSVENGADDDLVNALSKEMERILQTKRAGNSETYLR